MSIKNGWTIGRMNGVLKRTLRMASLCSCSTTNLNQLILKGKSMSTYGTHSLIRDRLH
ncbi:hypothetical protein RHMOL_Rhmol06G0117500 [Rhododendron molle]|uniref:Uncharacterized protein n=1 Tax=Rhododendron molle TaxID=49168 RepID=A0ACC0ND71_RHOML|nr:hypothetical protein RHMOL_Rhmol06G0117500 [Rhododendron molle]